MSRQLSIQLLGDFQLRYGDQSVTSVDTSRLQALLAYLLLYRDGPQSRQQLAFLFWPDSSETQARANLRQLLHHLRQALPNADQFLHLDTKTVQWRPTAPFACDVVTFEDHLSQARAAVGRRQADTERMALTAAVDSYHGDLLPGCYDDWILPERERRRAQFMTALERLSHLLEERRDYAAAIASAQRLLRHDPVHETTYVRLMRLYALNGDRASALRTYHTCVTVLERELGVDPHPITQEAYIRLLNLETAGEEVSTPARPVGGVRLIGRQAEWAQLQTAWRIATQGGAYFVLVTGEAGIGKTRLVEELLTWADRQSITTATAHLYATEGSLAYAPVIEWLRSPALQATLPTLDAVWLTEVARLLPELLVEQPTLPRPAPLNDQWQRQRFFEALARAVCATPSGNSRPKLLFIDDLHWCDGETLAWLRYLLHFGEHTQGRSLAPLLVVGAARAEEVGLEHPLTALLLDLRRMGQVTEIALTPLTAVETAELAAQVSTTMLDAASVHQLFTYTEGNPLFVVETVRAGQGEGERRREGDRKTGGGGDTPTLISLSPPLPVSLSNLPPKIHAIIHYRLGQLSPAARQLAALAATIGRSFTFVLLQQASGSPEDSLVQSLDELWQRGIVRAQGIHAYDFSHDRIREAAYTALGPVQRPLCHRRVAQALEQLYAERLDPVSAQLAVHYERADMAPQAIAYYQRAAEVEMRVLAYHNAITYLDMGLTLAGAQPRTVETVKQELMLLLTKASSLGVVEGFAAPKIASVYAQVEARLPEIADDSLQFQAHYWLRQYYGVSGQMSKTQKFAEQLLDLAPRLQDPGAFVAAYQGCGVVYLQQGRLQTAREHLEQAESVYRAAFANTPSVTPTYGGSPAIFGILAFTLWLLGYPDQAYCRAVEAVTLSEKQDQPLALSIALFFAASVYRYMGAVELTMAPAEKMLALDAKYQIPMARASGLLANGWIGAHQGKLPEGIAQIRAGIDTMKAINHTVYQTHRLAWLAEVQMQAGDWKTAADTLEEAFAMSDKTGQRSCDAELHRLRGEWLLQSKGQHLSPTMEATAEAAFGQAIDLARIQEARSFELRAVMSLSRLWQRQGKRAEAYQLLLETYGWFTEGFGSADLQAAKTLLTELI